MTELLERYFAGDRAKGFFVHHDNVLGLQAVKNYTHVFLASGKRFLRGASRALGEPGGGARGARA